MTEFDQKRIANWIGDAFAILCVRAGGGSPAERKVRLGFEAILRQLGTPPLRIITRSLPPPGRAVSATAADWRQIVHALDRCRAVFSRYGHLLDAAQQRTRALVETTRTFAYDALRARSQRPPAPPMPVAADPMLDNGLPAISAGLA